MSKSYCVEVCCMQYGNVYVKADSPEHARMKAGALYDQRMIDWNDEEITEMKVTEIEEESEMAEEKLKIEFEVTVTDRDIDDIMAWAMDSGISYWCDDVRVAGDYLGQYASDQISRGGFLILHDMEADKVFTLGKDLFLKGLKCVITDGSFDLDILENNGSSIILNQFNIDAIFADRVIQYAIFGECIYC